MELIWRLGTRHGQSANVGDALLDSAMSDGILVMGRNLGQVFWRKATFGFQPEL